ncbi:MAG: hypothetical protein COT74_06685 [Bdellovibrionales bacterium CG10_big_fil_rev_8_21_14_0_10_45_34]|nr:MAG: hypothetical protein COT74_06685 [Bdellovibrionales bacterium CG10_big_fil_rev_8_21_14_0_10_45_34]
MLKEASIFILSKSTARQAVAFIVYSQLLVTFLGCSSTSTLKSDAVKESIKDEQNSQSSDSSQANLAQQGIAANAGAEAEKQEYESPKPKKVSSDEIQQMKRSLEERNYEKAKEQARAVLERSSGNDEALLVLAAAYLGQGKSLMGRLVMRRISEKSKNSANYFYLMAYSYELEGEKELAQIELRKALQKDGDHYGAALGYGQVLLKAGIYDRAKDLLKVSHRKNKTNVEIANLYALCLEGLGDKRDALGVLEDSAVEKSSNEKILLNYARLLVENKKKPEKAREILNRIRLLTNSQDISRTVEDIKSQMDTKDDK